MQEDKAMLEVDESPLFPTLEESDPAADMNDPLQELTCLLGLCEQLTDRLASCQPALSKSAARKKQVSSSCMSYVSVSACPLAPPPTALLRREKMSEESRLYLVRQVSLQHEPSIGERPAHNEVQHAQESLFGKT